MKSFVISDIHANFEAFSAVISDIDSIAEMNARIVSLGDIVGYGACPNECIELAKFRVSASVLGNHDACVLGLTDVNLFNTVAKEALVWTQRILTRDSRDWLMALKSKLLIKQADATFTHASPYEPSQWHYLINYGIAKLAFGAMETPICFIGHSHQPVFIMEEADGTIDVAHPQERPSITCEPGTRYIVNVGSVGQPRDGINKACYVVWDDEAQTISVRRVSYNVRRTQQRIFAVELPAALAMRLETGL
ncbi:metallophosphoesterase family protein [bacterium]|nr:metallophosphoesterase family protein [bacterium]